MRHKLLLFFGTVLFLMVTVAYASAQGAPTVTYPSNSAVSPHLSDLPSSNSRGPLPLKKFARRLLGTRGASDKNAADHALQDAPGPNLNVDTKPNFAGIGENGYIPGDPNIAVGPNHVVEVVNSEVAVFDKSGHVFTGYPKRLGLLWSSLGGPCANNNGDAIAQYDRFADRFIITQLGSLSSPYSQCIAVSTSNDPTGSYHLYSYDFGSNLNDYDKFGVWPTASSGAYLATYNLFANGGPFVGADLCAYDRNAMLTGAATPAQVCFTISGDGGFLPADVDGPNAPLDGTPGLFLNFETLSSLRMYKLSPNFVTPANSTLSGPTDIGVAAFSEACGGGTCIPQPGTGQMLDSLGDRLMYRLAYRRFGNDHEAIVVNHSVVAGSSVGVRWYELRNSPPSTGATFSLFQQGTYAPNSSYRWMGSIAMDQAGDIGLGYSTSSTSVFPSVNYTGRIPSDAAGTMESEGTIQPGGGSQTSYSRWGDYSAMQIDPTDDCTFWYVNEFYPVTSGFAWNTAIGSFKFSNCTGTPDFSMSSAATPLTFTQGVGGSTTSGSVTVQSLNTFSSAVNLAVAGMCNTNGITCGLGAGSVTPSSGGSTNTTLTIGIGTGTPANSYSITINGASGALNHSTTLTVVVSAPPPPTPDFTISASTTSLTISRGSTGSSVISLTAGGGSSSVSLSVSGLPPRTSASFSTNPVTASGTSTLRISVNRKATTGTYTLAISGNNGSFTHSTPVTLNIK